MSGLESRPEVRRPETMACLLAKNLSTRRVRKTLTPLFRINRSAAQIAKTLAAVMVEAFAGGGQQTGGGTAAPIAQAVLAAALQPMTAQLGEG